MIILLIRYFNNLYQITVNQKNDNNMQSQDSHQKTQIKDEKTIQTIRSHLKSIMIKCFQQKSLQKQTNQYAVLNNQSVQQCLIDQFFVETNNQIIQTLPLSYQGKNQVDCQKELSHSLNKINHQKNISECVNSIDDEVIIQDLKKASKTQVLNQRNKVESINHIQLNDYIQKIYKQTQNLNENSTLVNKNQMHCNVFNIKQQFISQDRVVPMFLRKQKTELKQTAKLFASIERADCTQIGCRPQQSLMQQQQLLQSSANTFRKTIKKKSSTHLQKSCVQQHSFILSIKPKDKKESEYQQFLDQNLVQYFSTKDELKKKEKYKIVLNKDNSLVSLNKEKPKTADKSNYQYLNSYQKIKNLQQLNNCDLISLKSSTRHRTLNSKNTNKVSMLQEKNIQCVNKTLATLQNRIIAVEKQVMSKVPTLMKFGIKFKKTHKIR